MDEPSYPNTGANYHMTPIITHLQGIKSYTIIDSLLFGNGVEIKFLCVDHFKVSNTLLKLKNVLFINP